MSLFVCPHLIHFPQRFVFVFGRRRRRRRRGFRRRRFLLGQRQRVDLLLLQGISSLFNQPFALFTID